MFRIEVWHDTEHLRAFPNVKPETVKVEGSYLYFKYGSKESSVCVNKQNCFFIDVIKED